MNPIRCFIISYIILIAESMVLLYMGYNFMTWEYWAILVLTVCYMLTYVNFK